MPMARKPQTYTHTGNLMGTGATDYVVIAKVYLRETKCFWFAKKSLTATREECYNRLTGNPSVNLKTLAYLDLYSIRRIRPVKGKK